MKPSLLFITIFLIAFSNLYSQFNEPIQVNSPNFQVKFAEQQALKVIENEIYVSFLKKEDIHQKVTFGYSSDYGNSFNFTEIDTTGAHFSEPVFEILSNGTIAVFYTNYSYYSYISYSNLYKAISNDNGTTFDIEMISENVFRAPVVTSNNDVIQLCYITGKKNQLSYYEHFTNIEEFENANINQPVTRFKGSDVFHGPVHSNSDIWIEQGGGGNNNGWPTFHAMVTTAGNFLYYPTGALLTNSPAPMDAIFLGGWEEELLNPYEPTAADIRANGIRPFNSPNADIIYVKIIGATYVSWYGDIELVGYEDFPVYSWYPMNATQANAVINAGENWFEDSDIVWTNQIAIYDTTWYMGPVGIATNNSIFIEDQQLWIEGSIRGKQTWGCADTIFIVGDISYQGTTIGVPPDEDPVNMSDYFGLVSEKKILIKYKNIDPFENFEINNDNCCDIYLYGAFAALGQGDTLIYGNNACHYDGIFTYEYQHPHGSTPNFTAMSPYTLQDTLYTYIDFHKFIYPHSPFVPPVIEGFNLHGGSPVTPYYTCGYPYESTAYVNSYPNNNPSDYVFPYGMDWPAYNPVWPESAENIVFERGTIHLFGSLAQRRRGYVHRSGNDPYNHPNGYSNPSPWDLDNWHYDGCHPSTGYDKDYHYDSRLMNNLLPNYPHVNPGGAEQILNVVRSNDNGITFQTQFEQILEHMITDISIDQDNDLVVIAYGISSPGFLNLIISSDNGNSYIEDSSEILSVNFKNIKIHENEIYLFGSGYEYSLATQVDEIAKYDYINNIAELLESFEYYEIHLNNFNISDSNIKVYEHVNITEIPLNFDFIYAIDSDDFEYNYTWQSVFSGTYFSPSSKISIHFDESDSIYVSFLRTEYDSDGWGDLFLVSGYLDYLTYINNEEVNPMTIDISSYPNPFNPETKIVFNLPEEGNVKLEIFNIKGQKVKTLMDCYTSLGDFELIWDGKDENGKPVGSGIYFYKLQTPSKSYIRKCILLK